MSIQIRSNETISIIKKTNHVMLVDDSHLDLIKMTEMLDSTTDFKITAKAKDGYEALSILKNHHFDVIIVDLFMPKCDGLEFLKQAFMNDYLKNTEVIVLSEIQNENVIEQALNWGASYVIFKPFTSQILIERLRILTTHIKKENHQTQQIHSQIIKHLMDSGIPSHTYGYQYFRLAIEYNLKEFNSVFSITKTIYPYVAEYFNTSSGNVDKAMRHCLTLAYENNNKRLTKFLNSMKFKDPSGKPSNSEFIGMITEKIKENIIRAQS